MHSDRRRRTEVLSHLLEKAGVQGYLTTDDLMEVYPEVNKDAERLSVILMALRRRGVDILDSEDGTIQRMNPRPLSLNLNPRTPPSQTMPLPPTIRLDST